MSLTEPTTAFGSILNEIHMRLARIPLIENYPAGRTKEPDDTVIGISTEAMKRFQLAIAAINEELQPFMDQGIAISERIRDLLPKNLRTMSEMNAAILGDETMRTLHEENLRIAKSIIPLNELKSLLGQLVAAEVFRAFPDTRDHTSYGEVQITTDWEVVYLSQQKLAEYRRQQMPNGLMTEDGVQVIIMHGGPGPEPDDTTTKPRLQ
ncbi:MAG: hypothetical protein KBD06_00490 [Candidatus Pacebacteria bacterium]|nr:hypothetical protein [Candidatus Paceibacterota bacterium]